MLTDWDDTNRRRYTYPDLHIHEQHIKKEPEGYRLTMTLSYPFIGRVDTEGEFMCSSLEEAKSIADKWIEQELQWSI